MKIVTSILAIVLVVALGAGAYFYMNIYTPMNADLQRIKAGMPELDKAKAEIKRYKAQETRDTGWIPAAVEALQSALKEEIAAGKAEVAVSGSRVIVNISEQMLYTPGSKTFAKDTTTLSKLPSLLKTKGLEDKEVLVGNTTPSVPARGKGRKKAPAKDGRTLAGERSVELVKYLENKGGINAGTLVAAAFPPKPADRGFKIKESKTMIVIGLPPVAAGQEAAAPKPAATIPSPAAQPAQPPKPAAPATQPAAPQPVQPQPIPIQPAQPKGN